MDNCRENAEEGAKNLDGNDGNPLSNPDGLKKTHRRVWILSEVEHSQIENPPPNFSAWFFCQKHWNYCDSDNT